MSSTASTTIIYGICYADGNPSITDDHDYDHDHDHNDGDRDADVNADVNADAEIDVDDVERYMVACSSTGIICIWDTMANYSSNSSTNTSSSSITHNNRNRNNDDPMFSFKVCNGILYDIKFIPQYTSSSSPSSLSSSSSLLITCGECGVFVYQWDDILRHYMQLKLKLKSKLKRSNRNRNNIDNANIIIRPISFMSPNPLVNAPSLSILSSSPPSSSSINQQEPTPVVPVSVPVHVPIPPAEVNSISYDEISGYLYGACGSGGYIWDIATSSILGTLQTSNRDYEYKYQSGLKRQRNSYNYNYNYNYSNANSYLHTIKAVSSSSCSNGIGSGRDGSSSSSNSNCHLILTGNDSGYVGIWNGKNQKLIEMIDCKGALAECFNKDNNNNSSTTGNSSTSTTIKAVHKDSSFWVSNIDVDSSCQRSIIGGGIEQYSSKKNSNNSHNQNNNQNIICGYLALMDLQTRTVSACCTTRENVNDVAFYPCNTSNTSNSNTLYDVVSVGNHNIVSFWKSTDMMHTGGDDTYDTRSSGNGGSGSGSGSGRMIGRSWVSSPSAYSIAIQKRRSNRLNNNNCSDDDTNSNFYQYSSSFSSPLMSIGGVGCYIDCYSHYGTISSKMKFHS